MSAHGGRLGAEETPGRGARVRFTLPAPRRSRLEHRAAPPASRILLVDDSESIRYYVTAWLEEQGYRVDAAEDGRRALALLDAGRCPISCCST